MFTVRYLRHADSDDPEIEHEVLSIEEQDWKVERTGVRITVKGNLATVVKFGESSVGDFDQDVYLREIVIG